MDQGQVPQGPGRDEGPPGTPLPSGADWMTEEDWEASLAALASADEPDDPDLDLYTDPDHGVPYGTDGSLADELIAECREISAGQARAAAHAGRLGTVGALASAAAALGRRGPGMPGSAHRFPGEYRGPAAGFATGLPLDVAPGGAALASFADDASGDDAFTAVSDDELIGVLCAWDRVEAHASARKHAAIAELMRRRPAQASTPEDPEGPARASTPEDPEGPAQASTPEGSARMPQALDEFTADELCQVLAESRSAVQDMLCLAGDLEVKLPGTKAAFLAGLLRRSKVAIIARACEALDHAEARAAERLVLGRAGRLTPGGLRSAIARAVIQVAPDKARKRREAAARDARVERWAEDSGNAALVGRELPPAEVLAADQRVTAWAKELKKAGLTGSMDELRARAYLDLLLGVDSRPAAPAPADPSGQGPPGGGRSRAANPGPPAAPPSASPLAGVIPPGFAAKVNLTITLANLLELANRPGELGGIGPVDPWLARDLARAAARHPKTTFCLTVTDDEGHAIGHGCARPEPRNQRSRARPAPQDEPGPPHRPPKSPNSPSGTGSPGFTFTSRGPHGPPGGYGTWRLSAGLPGRRDLIIAVEPVPIDDCDHRRQAKGHNPGVMLRHLTEIRHATCTAPACRRPAGQCDFDHSVPYEAGGRTCACNGGPKCRHDHRLKQHPRWKVEQPTPGTFRWTTPSGRQYTTEPTRYPV